MKKVKSICVLIIGIFLITSFSESFAVENSNGGQVTTEGIVTFYEETSSSSSVLKESEPPKEKPKGRLPYTGELIKGSIILIGIVVIGFWVVFLIKKKKEGEPSK